MIGLFLEDEPEQPYEDLIRQRLALRRRIADCTTARARLEYQQSRHRQRGGDAGHAAPPPDFTARIDALNRLELVMRVREEQLTLRMHPREP
jgi:hypothetical protein